VETVLKLERAPSAIPDDLDRTTYLVIDACRGKGHVFRETALPSTDLEQVVSDLVEGQYVEPVGIVAFNVQEGWSRDLSVEVATEIERRCIADRRNLPKSLCKFITKQKSAAERPSFTRMPSAVRRPSNVA